MLNTPSLSVVWRCTHSIHARDTSPGIDVMRVRAVTGIGPGPVPVPAPVPVRLPPLLSAGAAAAPVPRSPVARVDAQSAAALQARSEQVCQ